MSTPDFLDSMHNQPEAAAPEADIPDVIEPDEPEEREEEEEEEQQPEAPKVEAKKDPEPTSGKESKEQAGFKAAMLAERQKRQALEARLREIEAKQQTEQHKPPRQFFEDPQAYVDERLQAVEARHMNALEADMREEHEDYDEVAQLVVDAAQSNPALQQQVFSAANPAKALYKLGLQLREAEKLKDPEAYKASLRDELKAELLAELRKEIGEPAAEKPKPNLPRDLSNGRSGTDQVATLPPTDLRRPPHLDKLFPVG